MEIFKNSKVIVKNENIISKINTGNIKIMKSKNHSAIKNIDNKKIKIIDGYDDPNGLSTTVLGTGSSD